MMLAKLKLGVTRRRLMLLSVAAMAHAAFGEGPNNILPYRVRMWQADDGLPQNSVWAIAQTQDGYLWVGTREGLARFDGVRFTLVEETQAPELRHGWITGLVAAQDGSLWIGCDGGGLTRWKEGRFSHFTETNGLPSSQTKCLLETRDGSIWIGTDSGLTRYKDGRFSTFTQRNGLGDNWVRSMCEDHTGTLRVATRQGLSSIGTNGVIANLLGFGAGYVGNALRYVCEDHRGHLWAGSTDGLYCQEAAGQPFRRVSAGLADQTVNAIYEDSARQLWVGTYVGLARLVDGKVIGRTGNAEGLFGDLVYAIFEDREGNIWVGAQDGLYRLNPARFTTYTTEQGLARNNVMSVCEDRSGTVWLGTWGGGLNELQGDTITTFLNTNAVPRDSVLSLHEGRDGRLWLGMEFPPGGLEQFRDGRRVPFPRQTGLINDAIRVIHEDRRGTVWIGTTRGLNALRDGKFATYTTANGLAGDKVLAICEDNDGAVWIGTDGGLSRWQAGRFVNFGARDGLSHSTINAIYLDKAGALWLGTGGGGLDCFRQGRFTVCTTRDGLFSDDIYEILEDDFGYFWMSCRRGIFRVARKELEDFQQRKLKVVTCTVFGKADGLASVQCNGVSKPDGWKGSDGRLWFPTIRGVVAVESRIKTNDKPPPVIIEEVLADRKRVTGGILRAMGTGLESTAYASPAASGPAIVTVPPGRGELEFHFTALSLQAPEKNLFKYMLENGDASWSEASAQRTAHYLRLAPGRYRFRVLASNNDGVWNQAGAEVSLWLLPHFWQTWWFRVGVLAGFALLLTLLYRLRVARLRELERLRVEIAANLHDDVGARLTKVAMMTELMDQQTGPGERSKPAIQAVFQTTREVIQAMDEIVWTINPKNDTLDHLANYVFQYAQEYFQHTRVRCRLDLPAQLPELPVSTEMRHNLFMAVKEALNNVLKHAAATEVRISLAVSEARITLSIADNGRGFMTDRAPNTGEGLRNMRERMHKIGGTLLLESVPGSGTRVQMEVDAG